MTVKGGIDLGGTKIQAVVVDASDEVMGEAKLPTPQGRPAGGGGADRRGHARGRLGAGVGTASSRAWESARPGRWTPRPGSWPARATCPAGRRPSPSRWRSRSGWLPVALGNDVQVAVDGEFALGAGRRDKSLLGVWWGTGVGGGIILDGKPWIGRGAAAEIGHIVVKMGGARCTVRPQGCMEAYAGRGSMEIEAPAR